MRIGTVHVGKGALLAPMEAVTDLAFRSVCEDQGAALTYTEFLSADALTRGAAKTLARLWPSLHGRPFAVQIVGREPTVMADAARMAADAGATIVDINMGCPARKVTSGSCGSALMREPALAAAIVGAVRAVLPPAIPVTVKHRAGWDDRSLNAAEFARTMVEAGAALITVHGRTRAQGFSGTVRLGPIADVRRALPRSIPVVGNGDVLTVADYLDMKRATACDAVMIGRGCRGNPWLFRDILAVENGRPMPDPPTVAERRTVWRLHADRVVQYTPPKMVVHELRKTLAWYSKGLFGGADLRNRCFQHPDPTALLDLGDRYFERLADRASRGDLHEAPAPAIVKAMQRHARRSPASDQALEPCDA